jgi:hypothetical protein
MPRELDDDRPAAPVLTESPNSVATERSESPLSQNDDASPLAPRQRQFVIVPQAQQLQEPTNLHPYTRPLTISDLDSCVALENAAFTDPRDRATPEKVSPFLPTSVACVASCARDNLPDWTLWAKHL